MPKCKNCKHLEQLEGMWCWCPIRNDSYDLNQERSCKEFVHMKNIDKIKRMNDEELSSFICGASRGCDYCNGYDLCVLGDGEANGMLKWLNQKVEEE